MKIAGFLAEREQVLTKVMTMQMILTLGYLLKQIKMQLQAFLTYGDIICKGNVQNEITKQSDLEESYNITSININNIGNEPHIHLGGK